MDTSDIKPRRSADIVFENINEVLLEAEYHDSDSTLPEPRVRSKRNEENVRFDPGLG